VRLVFSKATDTVCPIGKRWNLDPDTISGLVGFKSFNRPQDLLGIEIASPAKS